MAVYAVKTTTDPDTPQEVATVDEGKKALMKEIFRARTRSGAERKPPQPLKPRLMGRPAS